MIDLHGTQIVAPIIITGVRATSLFEHQHTCPVSLSRTPSTDFLHTPNPFSPGNVCVHIPITPKEHGLMSLCCPCYHPFFFQFFPFNHQSINPHVSSPPCPLLQIPKWGESVVYPSLHSPDVLCMCLSVCLAIVTSVCPVFVVVLDHFLRQCWH